MELKSLIKEYLSAATVMQLATLHDGKPQMCTVHFAFDDKFNMYWSSSNQSHHSQNLEQSQSAAVAVLHNVGDRQCVHAEGEAHLVSGAEAIAAYTAYSAKFGADEERLAAIKAGTEDEGRFYVFKPHKFVIFDAKNFPESPRQEFVLDN